MRPELIGFRLADPPERWEALGFDVGSNHCDIGVRLWLGCPGTGIAGWALTGIRAETTSIDGLPTELARYSTPPAPPEHPNGAIAIDHVVVTTSDFDRTSGVLEEAGLALRRVVAGSNGTRMGFRRLGSAILELVEAENPASGPARFWGLVVVVQDLDALADRLGEHLGSIRDAVQPGRRIATLRESAGLGESVAFMTPDPPVHSQ